MKSYPKFKFLLLAMVMACCPLLSEAKIYLVSVGIADYKGEKNDLHLTRYDASVMQWVYQQNKNAETRLLLDGEATLSAVKSAMNSLYRQATANDIVVLFFSGHGLPKGLVCYDGLLTYREIARTMESLPCKSKMVFADACFAGALRDQTTNDQSLLSSLGKNIMFLLACRSNETSKEMRRGMKNGLFTYALQHALRGSADVNGDRVITAKEVFNYVSTQVKKLSKGKQNPVMWGNFPDTMPILKW